MVNPGANIVNPFDPDSQQQKRWTDLQNAIRNTYQPKKTTSSSISDRIAQATAAMNSIPTVTGDSAEVSAINAANAKKRAELQRQIDMMNDQMTMENTVNASRASVISANTQISLNRQYPNAQDGMVVSTREGYYKKQNGQWVRI